MSVFVDLFWERSGARTGVGGCFGAKGGHVEICPPLNTTLGSECLGFGTHCLLSCFVKLFCCGLLNGVHMVQVLD